MPWYAAKLVFQCVVGVDEGQAPSLCDEQLRLIEAPNANLAYDSACELGRSDEVTYDNPEGETVRWAFRGLGDLAEVLDAEFESGVEVWSTMYEDTEPSLLVADRDQLAVFVSEATQHRTAGELLARHLRRYAPK